MGAIKTQPHLIPPSKIKLMTIDTHGNPFKSGSGLDPPHLAGRREEINVIKTTLDEIKGGAGRMDKSPEPILALVGPRGVGKTVLLQRALEEAEKRGIHVGEVKRQMLSGPQGLIVKRVFPQGKIKKEVGRFTSISAFIAATGFAISRAEADDDLDTAMRAFMERSPMLLILDEAHHCEPEGLSMIFDIVQGCMRERLPLAFIIAGTPGLVPHLRRCNSTYVERSDFLRFNTLSREESKEALEIPARRTGLPMEEAALKCLLDWSDDYPFFIQMAGKNAWNIAKARGASVISLEDANKALAVAEKLRREFYDERYVELGKYDLAPYALQVIHLIEKEPGNDIGYKKLIVGILEANEGMENKRAVEIYESLLNLGFIYKNGIRYEAGIPTLFDYVREQEEA